MPKCGRHLHDIFDESSFYSSLRKSIVQYKVQYIVQYSRDGIWGPAGPHGASRLLFFCITYHSIYCNIYYTIRMYIYIYISILYIAYYRLYTILLEYILIAMYRNTVYYILYEL